MKTTYIAFLRAVNVGGRVVRMERLRALFAELGHSEVRTHIQSGNVFFATSKADRDALARRIEKHLAGALGYEVPAMLRTIAEVEATLALDPFRDVVVTPDTRLCVLFTSAPVPRAPALPLEVPKQGFTLLARTKGEIFVVMRVGAGRVGNPAAFVEKTFGVKATARFFHTTRKIVDAAKLSPRGAP